MRDIVPGDVVAVPTRTGIAYAQYLRYVRPYGALVRVLPGEYADAPQDLHDVVEQRERFWGFVPLAQLIDRDIVTVVGNLAIPEHAREMPLMRTPAGGMNSQRWWLWDGETEWQVDRTDPRLPDASLKATYNDTALIEAIEGGRTPRGDFERWQR